MRRDLLGVLQRATVLKVGGDSGLDTGRHDVHRTNRFERNVIEPNFPCLSPDFRYLSELAMVKCVKRADGCGFGCDRGGAEVKRRRVRHNNGRFNCRSIPR